MSVDLLQRAAAALREHAGAATPGPWEHVDYQGAVDPAYVTYMGCGSVVTMNEDLVGGDIAAPSGDPYPRSGYAPKEDMAYVALMHPPVALALAATMEQIAWMGHLDPDLLARVGCDELIATARAVLREWVPA